MQKKLILPEIHELTAKRLINLKPLCRAKLQKIPKLSAIPKLPEKVYKDLEIL